MNDEIDDDEQQLIKLCLKKPKKWNWELTTSKSSSNISFPMIQLYDETSKCLLAEASEAGFTASSKLKKSASVSKASSLRREGSKKRDNLRVRIKQDPIDEISLQPIITEPDDKRDDVEALDLINSERGSVRRDSNAKEFNRLNERPRGSYSRSSSNSMRSRSSASILGRISELKRSSSSDDSDADNDNDEGDKPKQKYTMRRCTLGTIIVPLQNFGPNVRRRPKKNDDDSGESSNYFHLLIYF